MSALKNPIKIQPVTVFTKTCDTIRIVATIELFKEVINVNYSLGKSRDNDSAEHFVGPAGMDADSFFNDSVKLNKQDLPGLSDEEIVHVVLDKLGLELAD